MDNKRFSKKLILALSLLILGFFTLWAWSNKWEIHDHWVSKGYKSSGDSSEVLTNLKLTDKGELVYKASLTEVDNKDNFRQRCPVKAYEDASVLGCYSARRIYVLKVDEPKLTGVEVVTAAHELLHAKFERMDDREKAKARSLITELRKSTQDPEITELISSYESKLGEGEGLDNELFAIYGTQLKDVGAGLERIYADYFKDRLSIVSQYESYSFEFKKTQQAIEGYDARLSALKDRKDELEAELEVLDSELSIQKAQLSQLQFGDSAEEYQRAANDYNVKVNLFNAKVSEVREIIDEYNALVEKRNSEALSAKSLADKLNANVVER